MSIAHMSHSIVTSSAFTKMAPPSPPPPLPPAEFRRRRRRRRCPEPDHDHDDGGERRNDDRYAAQALGESHPPPPAPASAGPVQRHPRAYNERLRRDVRRRRLPPHELESSFRRGGIVVPARGEVFVPPEEVHGGVVVRFAEVAPIVVPACDAVVAQDRRDRDARWRDLGPGGTPGGVGMVGPPRPPPGPPVVPVRRRGRRRRRRRRRRAPPAASVAPSRRRRAATVGGRGRPPEVHPRGRWGGGGYSSSSFPITMS